MKLPFFGPSGKSGTYEVHFKVTAKNLTSKQNNLNIVMPFPSNTAFQKLIGAYTTSPRGKLKQENRFKNRYVYWEDSLKPKEEKVYEVKFKITLKVQTFSEDKQNLSKFLKQDKFISPKKVLKISRDLTKSINNTYQKVRILNNYVVNLLEYGNPIKGLYKTSDALDKNKVDCGGFDTLLASLCIAQKIPARIISGFFASEKNQMHAWLEIFIPDKGWVVADPSIEKLRKEGRSNKNAALGKIPADRIALSQGQDIHLNFDNKHMVLDILQNPEFIAAGGQTSIKFGSEFAAKKINK